MNAKSYSSKKVDYVVGFSVSGGSGKEKATQEKAAQLASKVGAFRLFSASSSGVFSQLICELHYLLQGLVAPKPDLIISRSYWGFGAGLLGMLRGVPVVREVHAHLAEEVDILCADRPVRRVLLKLVASIQLWWFRRSNGLVFNNPLLEQYYLDRYLSGASVKTTTVFNGANVTDFYPQEASVLKQRLKLDSDSVHLLFCGSVSQWHGVDLLIDFFDALSHADNRFRLTIVGGGEEAYYQQLKDRCSEIKGLSFIGKVKPDTARDYMCAADLCMLPVADIRVSPGSPLKLYDYIACGKPVVAQANTPGYSDVVEEYGLGMAVDFSDPERAVPVFLDWYSSFDQNDHKDHNRRKAETELSWSAVIDRWLAFGIDLQEKS